MNEKGLHNKAVAAVLREIALFLELKGGNPFKVKAYINAARAIDILEKDLGVLMREGSLREIAGIGETLAQQIGELLGSGRLGLHEELRAAIPPGHLDMLKIPGLGPKKIKALSDALGIKTIGELEYACLENRLSGLPGFGQKSQAKILQGLQQIKKYQGCYLYGEMIGIADEMLRKMMSHRSVSRASLAGSLRRKMEVVRNINLVVSTSRPQEVLAACSKLPEVEVVRLGNEADGLYSLLSGIQVELRTVSEEVFPHSLYHRTGSLSHWRSMCRRAEAMGLELKEEGLQRDGRLIPCKEEEEIFGVLGLDFIPPELREDQGEIEAAEVHQLPILVRDQDIQGVFHIHSLYSDGVSAIKGMAEAARKMGLSYIGLADHSQSARYAGGLTVGRLQQQWAEVEKANQESDGFHIFKGTEADILSDGSLDYDNAVLSKFDFVVASVHSHFSMPRDEMTRRVIKAVRNPYTTILGHPTGRLLLAREPYEIDMIRVIDEAARSGVAIELNAHPYRLDLDWRLCRYAKERGVKIAINPDAHEEKGLRDTYFGVGAARKGWLQREDVLNTLDLQEMKNFLRRRKEKAGIASG